MEQHGAKVLDVHIGVAVLHEHPARLDQLEHLQETDLVEVHALHLGGGVAHLGEAVGHRVLLLLADRQVVEAVVLQELADDVLLCGDLLELVAEQVHLLLHKPALLLVAGAEGQAQDEVRRDVLGQVGLLHALLRRAQDRLEEADLPELGVQFVDVVRHAFHVPRAHVLDDLQNYTRHVQEFRKTN